MRELLIAYLAVVIALLALSTSIDAEEGVNLKHIFVAAFGWPIIALLLAWRAWAMRSHQD